MSLLRILLVVLLATVVESYAKNETIGIPKTLYMLCVTLDKFVRRYRMSTSLQFALDMVNNRSNILPGYNLQIICGYSERNVSFICRTLVLWC